MGRANRTSRAALGAILIALFVSGCSVRPPLTTDPNLRLGISNGTTLAVTLLVNGVVVAVYAPGTAGEIEPLKLAPLPWAVEARSPSGRLLLSITVLQGSVWSTATPGGGSIHSVGDRVDRSCGRLDMYAGAPMHGPMPGPGTPGDCEP